jgi:flagellar assembly protein FliH
MSRNPVIPREKLSAYQRWELHSFDPDTAPRTAGAVRAADAAEKVQHLHQQVYQSGYADGLREGAQKAAGDMQRLQALLASVKQQSHEINQSIAQDMLGLSLEVARQMLRQALAVKPELIIPVVQDALARISRPLAQASISLHPEDAGLVREHLAEQLAADGWKIVEDAKLARGGCLLQTSANEIDATVGKRWQQVVTALGQNTRWLD